MRFSDREGQRDIFAILKENKFNWIRLRIFNNPRAKKGYSKSGYCDLAHTLQMAKRIKAAGMKFLLDFHYSDTWADPSHQTKPLAWKDFHGKGLQPAVHDYTREVLAAMKQQGVSPNMVQIGNEISNGFLWPDGQVWKSNDWKAFCGLIKAGTAGTKEADPSIKIVLHLAWGGQNAQSRAFLDKVLAQGVDFNVIGQSYYPRWHGTLRDLKANLNDLAGRYKQGIIVVEYAAPNLKEINEIVHDIPRSKGLGAFLLGANQRRTRRTRAVHGKGQHQTRNGTLPGDRQGIRHEVDRPDFHVKIKLCVRITSHSDVAAPWPSHYSSASTTDASICRSGID